MKKHLLTLLAFIMFLSFGSITMPQTAQAEEIQFELLGKLGVFDNGVDNDALGVPIADLGGGLQATILFRYEMGLGIGLNFNWNMSNQRLEQTKLTYALGTKKREMETQLPSIGIAARYQIAELFDVGLWLNYSFGSTEITYDQIDKSVASAFGLTTNQLLWELQTVELGINALFYYKIDDINLDILLGIQAYFDYSSMTAHDTLEMHELRDIEGHYLAENSLISGGLNVVFGFRYDLIW